MLFRQFSNIIMYVKIVGNIPDQYLNVWLFSIPGDKVQKDRELQDKSVPYFQQESGPCPLDWRITIHSNVHLVFFQQSWHIWLCWKIAKTIFKFMVVLQSRGHHFILVEIYWSQDLRVEHNRVPFNQRGFFFPIWSTGNSDWELPDPNIRLNKKQDQRNVFRNHKHLSKFPNIVKSSVKPLNKYKKNK